MKRVKLFSVVILIGIVIFGLHELSYQNDIFAETLKPCCNLSHCRYDWDVPCSTIATASIKEYHPKTGEFIGCSQREYEITCQLCVDLNAAGEICDDPSDPPNSCITAGGSCYGWCYTPGTGWGWILQK